MQNFWNYIRRFSGTGVARSEMPRASNITENNPNKDQKENDMSTPATPETTPKPETAVVVAPKREVRVVDDDSPIAYLMDTSRFEHCYRIAGAMARASLIPKHLKGDSFEQTQANCFLVVNQALRWQLDPFAVAPETYEVGGKLGFQGKLVAAVINARGGLADKLSYTFNDGKGDDLEVTVSGRLKDEEEARTVTVSVKQARTQNQMWTKDPQQKLIYTGAIKWARRHKPEVILGVLTDDDAEAMREEARFLAATPVKSPDFGGRPGAPAPARRVVVSTSQPTQPAKPAQLPPPRAAGNPQNTGFRTAEQPAGPLLEDVTEYKGMSSEVLKSRKLPTEAPRETMQEAARMPQDVSEGVETAPEASNEQPEAPANGTEPSGASQEQESPVVEAEASPITAQAELAEIVGSILYQAEQAGVTQRQIMSWCLKKRVAREGQTKLTELSTTKLKTLNKGFRNNVEEIAKEIK